MVFRLSNKLAKKIHLQPDERLPLDKNPFADWSAHVFTAGRVQYILISNTASLYSVVTYGRGVVDTDVFCRDTFSLMRDLMNDDGFAFIAKRHVFSMNSSIMFSKALDRHVIGSMNDLIVQAKCFLQDGEMSPYGVSFRLNETPLKHLKYGVPKEVFQSLSRVNT